MRMRRYLITLISVIVVLAGVTAAVSAKDVRLPDGTCVFNGKSMKISFPSGKLQQAVSGLEPGDTLEFEVIYKNNSKKTTDWYMRNRVLETLEDNKDAAENGGYTYVLKNVGPGNKETVLFDNSQVGGETVVADLEGLKQATNATTEYFHIQKLGAGQSGKTKLRVELDGETEVNDYMDTKGALDLAYAVETTDKKITDGKKKTYESNVKTGDDTNLTVFIAAMAIALITGALALVSRKKDRKDGREA